jgi:hypothetical protein
MSVLISERFLQLEQSMSLDHLSRFSRLKNREAGARLAAVSTYTNYTMDTASLRAALRYRMFASMYVGC